MRAAGALDEQGATGGLRRCGAGRWRGECTTVDGDAAPARDRPGVDDRTLPADRAFSIGGPRTFPAYQFDEARARSYWLADMGFVWHMVDLLALFDQNLYGGCGWQA